MKPRFIARAKSREVIGTNGVLLTKAGTTLTAWNDPDHYGWLTTWGMATEFDTPEAALAFLKNHDGYPWYNQIEPGTEVVEDVSADLQRRSKSELIARIKELEGASNEG